MCLSTKIHECKNKIEKYHKVDTYDKKRIYERILEEYKTRYTYNESQVEGNVTVEEQMGIATIYDYISNFNFETDYFNIFTTSLIIHQKLYSFCPGEGFGGNLRDTQALLKDTCIEVMSAEDAKKFFNSFIKTSDEIFLPLEEGNILKYIENCITVTTELIKAQPFADGNKRTFRSLLNMLFKKITLPPVYIPSQLNKRYKEALLKAMQDGDYIDLYNFYYERIEDAIKELALEKNEYENYKVKEKKLVEDLMKI